LFCALDRIKLPKHKREIKVDLYKDKENTLCHEIYKGHWEGVKSGRKRVCGNTLGWGGKDQESTIVGNTS